MTNSQDPADQKRIADAFFDTLAVACADANVHRFGLNMIIPWKWQWPWNPNAALQDTNC